MQTIKVEKYKRLAKVSLIVCLALVILQLLSIYQTRRQLVSPLIPRSTGDEILSDSMSLFGMDYILTPVLFSIATFIGLLFYFYKKYLVVVLIGIIFLIAYVILKDK